MDSRPKPTLTRRESLTDAVDPIVGTKFRPSLDGVAG
jgi:hypothetical protein